MARDGNATRDLGVALVAFGVGGLAWRLWLVARFFGWEESDYGNLAMARGVLESGFTRFDMNHCPLYYGLSALVLAVVGDAWVATRIVSLAGGMAGLLVMVALAWRMAGARAAWLAGLLVVVQPELALYSSSALREPLYLGFFMAALALATRERLALASVAAAGAFLTRFDAMFVLVPVLALQALGRAPRLGRLLRALLPLGGAILAWSFYCHVEHGTWAFWGHSVDVNLETGGGMEAVGRGTWARHGLAVSLGMLGITLPHHMGALLALAGSAGAVFLAFSGHGARRTVAAALGLATGFWLSIGFFAQHEIDHNLYWKWMTPLVPLWGLAGGLLLDALTRWLQGRVGRPAVLLLVVAGFLSLWFQQGRETRTQLLRAEALYLPQLQLARDVEAGIPEDIPLILDNIPGCWINREVHGRRLWTWLDVPVPAGDEVAFAAWIREERIGYALWFAEAWTRAPVVAPWLARGGRVELEGVVFQELDREDQYGWIWYRVEAAPVDKPGEGR